MACDFLDWCQGPEGAGCRFVTEDLGQLGPEDTHFGYCPSCKIEVREIDG